MIPGILAAKGVQTGWALFKRFWWAVPMLALVVALLLTRGALDRTKDALETQRQALAAEQAEHAVTIGSVNTLQAAIMRQNAAINERSAALEAAKVQAAKDIAAADDKWRDTADQVERLRSLARSPARPGCEVPKQLAAELENL